MQNHRVAIHVLLCFISSTSRSTSGVTIMITQFPTTDFTEHTACLFQAMKLSVILQDQSTHKRTESTDKNNTFYFFSKQIRCDQIHYFYFARHQPEAATKTIPVSELFGKREKSGKTLKKKTNFAMISPLSFAAETTKLPSGAIIYQSTVIIKSSGRFKNQFHVQN